MASTLQETVREDGLRVITKRLRGTKRVIVCVSGLVGSAYDPVDKEGLFHFFEHMAFKGTRTKTMSQVKERLGQMVNSNAYTAALRTTYFGEAVCTKLPLLQEIVFDIYSNSIFPEEEIEKEKEVVLNEAAMYEDNDSYKAYFLLYEMLWARNPQRRVGVGTADGLANINRNILLHAHQYWYAAPNTVVVAVGSIEHEQFARDAFAAIPFSESKAELSHWEDEANDLPSDSIKITEKKNREKGVVILGCKVPALSEKDADVVKLLSEIIGGGFDSLLWSEVREKRGLVYSAGSHFNENNLASYLAFSAEMLPKRIDEVKELMADIVCNYPITETHFQRARACLEDTALLSLEDAGDWSRMIHKKIIDDKHDLSSLSGHINKRIKIIHSIAFEEIIEARKKLITPERLACAIIKPV